MENYTVFYDLVVALKQVTQGKQALSAGGYYHAEAFFFYLRACVENTGALVRDARKLLNGAAIRPQIKSIPDNLMKEVKRYRDVASHRPLLGRGSKYGREMMMKVHLLPEEHQDVMMWTEAELLEGSSMEDVIDLQVRQWNDVAEQLMVTWEGLTSGFEELRVHQGFIDAVGLKRFLPISRSIGNTAVPSMVNETGASGKQVY